MKAANFPERKNQRRKNVLARFANYKKSEDAEKIAQRQIEKAILEKRIQPYSLTEVRTKKNRSARAGKSQRVGF